MYVYPYNQILIQNRMAYKCKQYSFHKLGRIITCFVKNYTISIRRNYRTHAVKKRIYLSGKFDFCFNR